MHRILSSFKIFPSIFNLYGLLFLTFLYMPLALIVLYSFNANPINMAVWTGFTFDWYRTIFGGAAVETTFDAAFSESPQRIFEVVKNSFLVAVSRTSALVGKTRSPFQLAIGPRLRLICPRTAHIGRFPSPAGAARPARDSRRWQLLARAGLRRRSPRGMAPPRPLRSCFGPFCSLPAPEP